MDLIKMQVERVLRRGLASEQTVAKVLKGIQEEWIAEVSIYGLDSSGACHAELFVKIDWARKAFHISAGRETVNVDASWKDGISAEVDSSLSFFENVVQSLGLTKSLVTRYAPGQNRNDLNARLGFVPAEPVRWASGALGTVMSIPELDEFAVGVKVV